MDNSTDDQCLGSFEDIHAEVTSEIIGQPFLRSEENIHLLKCSSTTNDNKTEEVVTTLLTSQEFTKKIWRIVKFPLRSNDYLITSPVLTEIYGHAVQLVVYSFDNDGEARVRVSDQQLPDATKNDLIKWPAISFQLCCNNTIIEADSNGWFSLGCLSEIDLDGEDLILELIVNHMEFKTGPTFHTIKSQTNSIGKMGLLLILLSILTINVYTDGFHVNEQPDLAALKQIVIELNNNLKEVSRLIEIVDNCKHLLPDVVDEIKLLRKSQQSFETKMWRANNVVEPVEQGRRNYTFTNIVNGLQPFFCKFGKMFLPKKLRMATCTESNVAD